MGQPLKTKESGGTEERGESDEEGKEKKRLES